MVMQIIRHFTGNKSKKQKVLILGANGMLGSMLYRKFCESLNFETIGLARSFTSEFGGCLKDKLIFCSELDNPLILESLLETHLPDVVINCIGIVKQNQKYANVLEVLKVNSLFPHQLLKACQRLNIRLLHISTDCVFSGSKGNYDEGSVIDAADLYGLSKYLGEVISENSLTLRSSIIGHELSGAKGLLEWFLRQNEAVQGFKNCLFSGLPTNEFFNILEQYVLCEKKLSGLYHISSEPISKYDLLHLIASVYKKEIKIFSIEEPRINRTLNSDKFRNATGYHPKSWVEMVSEMYRDHLLQ